MKQNSLHKNQQLMEQLLQIGVIGFIVYFCFNLLSPFILPVLWACILAVILYPSFNFLLKLLGGRRKMAATIVTLLMLLLLFIPITYFVGSLSFHVFDLYNKYEAGNISISAPTANMLQWPIIGKPLYSFLSNFAVNLEAFFSKYQSEILAVLKSFVAGLASSSIVFFQFVLSIIIAGILLASTDLLAYCKTFFKRIAGEESDEILAVIYNTIHQVVKGVLVVAIIQTMLLSFGYFMAEVPYAGVLSLLCLVLSIIQIGPLPINIGVIIYLFTTGNKSFAIFWTIYLLLASVSDNILKPILLSKGSTVPMIVIFLGVLGGFMSTGFIGLFIGPIILSIGYKLFMIWLNSEPKLAEGHS